MVKRPSPIGNPKFLKVTVRNVGTTATTLTNLSLHRYDSRWSKIKNRADWNAVVNEYQGPSLPHKLDVGAEWMVTMQEDENFGELISTKGMWCAIHHAFSDSSVQVKIVRTA